MTDTIKRIGKKAKSKRGTTLIEMMATVAILSIVATMSLQAMFIAAEEYRKTKNLSEAQRSISLMQRNINRYLKGAVDVKLVDSSSYPGSTMIDKVNAYIDDRNGSPDIMNDSEHPRIGQPDDEFDDLILYRKDVFTYALAKYNRYSTSIADAEIFSVENIKEMNFRFYGLTSTVSASGDMQYMLDYTITSPTNSEMIEKNAIVTETAGGDYSIASGMIMNNMYGSYSTAVSTLRISEGLNADGSSDSSKYNFIVFRVRPQKAN